MVGSVKEGPNHYEILGLTPSATGDEIAKAFATRMQSHITNPGEKVDDYALKLRAAYKTLGDPFWRRIYDAELGLASKPRPEPTLRHPPQSAAEQRVAPFIAAAFRQPAGQTEHPSSPDFILLPDSEAAESTVEERPEPFITKADYPTDYEASVADARGRRRQWYRAGAATGAAVLGLGLVTLLIGLWGNFDLSPKTAGPPASTTVKQTASRSGIVTQTAPQQAAPIEEGSGPFPAGTTAAPVQAGGPDPVPVDDSVVGGPAQAATADGVADTQIAGQPESANVASSADPLAPAAAAASASSADSPTAAPVTVAQSPPAAVAQPVSPAPAVRSAPVVNRAAAPKWISGSLVKGDNPRGRYRGTVTVRFTVQPNGRVSGCRAAVSSGSTALDARTCQLVEQRLRFRPALDWQGRAIPYETRATYTWGAKRRSLLDQLLKPNRR